MRYRCNPDFAFGGWKIASALLRSLTRKTLPELCLVPPTASSLRESIRHLRLRHQQNEGNYTTTSRKSARDNSSILPIGDRPLPAIAIDSGPHQRDSRAPRPRRAASPMRAKGPTGSGSKASIRSLPFHGSAEGGTSPVCSQPNEIETNSCESESAGSTNEIESPSFTTSPAFART